MATTNLGGHLDALCTTHRCRRVVEYPTASKCFTPNELPAPTSGAFKGRVNTGSRAHILLLVLNRTTPEVGAFEKEEPVKGESQPNSGRPLLTSYDSVYEHSLEHWLDVQQSVEVDETEPSEDTVRGLLQSDRSYDSRREPLKALGARMDITVREHINRLESRLQGLNREIMQNRASQEERNRLEAEIRAANLALTHYRATLEIENQCII
jgi:hypothetical protein